MAVSSVIVPDSLPTLTAIGALPEPTTVYSSLAPVISAKPSSCSAQLKKMLDSVACVTWNIVAGSGEAVQR